MIYDLIIIGAGPAGLTAGMYAGRRHLKTLILSENLGGQAALAHLVENWPGTDTISGVDLVENMKKQAEKFGCEIKMEKVDGVKFDKDIKEVWCEEKKFEAKAVLIASGVQHRTLNIGGEDKYLGKGVSYCATCDGPLFKGKKVIVAGGSDSACLVAIYLSKIASETYMIHRRDKLRADEYNQQKAIAAGVKIIWNSVVEEIIGDKMVNKIKIKDVNTEKSTEMDIDGVFIEIGYIPSTGIMQSAGVKVDEHEHVVADENGHTNLEGVFAAGDITGGFKQIVTAAAKGATAATSAYFYIQKKFGHADRKDVVDWGHK